MPKRQGHGIGLKSIEAITRKHNGVFACSCTEGEFQFKAVLFADHKPAASPPVSAPRKKPRNILKVTTFSAFLSLLVFFLVINCIPVIAQGLAEIPVLGGLVQFVDLRSRWYSWGDTSFNIVYPVMDTDDTAAYEKPSEASRPAGTESTASQSATAAASDTASQETGSSAAPAASSGGSATSSANPPQETQQEPQTTQPVVPSQPASSTEPSAPDTSAPPADITDGIEDMNQQIDSYIAEIQEKFLWYVARKYDGYVAMDTDYRILRDDDRLFTVCFETTINVGGSSQYSRCLTLDKQTGNLLELEDLFQPDSDYIGIISRDILRQMTEQVESGEADYFIPGGIWSEEECFKEIQADQNFYINNDGRLVIVFDEYEVAPGSMGRPEFVIPTDILQAILLQPSCIG